MQLGSAAIFCETFDNKNPGIPSRTGDLDPNVWGVSRATGNVNFGHGRYNGWAATTQIQTCNGTKTVAPPNDIIICNGQFRQASNDNPIGVTTFLRCIRNSRLILPEGPARFRLTSVTIRTEPTQHGRNSGEQSSSSHTVQSL